VVDVARAPAMPHTPSIPVAPVSPVSDANQNSTTRSGTVKLAAISLKFAREQAPAVGARVAVDDQLSEHGAGHSVRHQQRFGAAVRAAGEDFEGAAAIGRELGHKIRAEARAAPPS
jgi:hypothetical protein